MTPGNTDSMSVTVAVPAAAPLGDYTVTLTASNGSPATKRSNTATITVADQVAPSIRISTPQNGSGSRSAEPSLPTTAARTRPTPPACSPARARSPTARASTRARSAASCSPSTRPTTPGTAAATTITYTIRPRPAPAVTTPFTYIDFIPKTALSFLQVRAIPKGSTLTVQCKGKRCPVRKRFRQVNPKKNVTLKSFFPKAYPAGTMTEARVAKTGRPPRSGARSSARTSGRSQPSCASRRGRRSRGSADRLDRMAGCLDGGEARGGSSRTRPSGLKTWSLELAIVSTAAGPGRAPASLAAGQG